MTERSTKSFESQHSPEFDRHEILEPMPHRRPTADAPFENRNSQNRFEPQPALGPAARLPGKAIAGLRGNWKWFARARCCVREDRRGYGKRRLLRNLMPLWLSCLYWREFLLIRTPALATQTKRRSASAMSVSCLRCSASALNQARSHCSLRSTADTSFVVAE